MNRAKLLFVIFLAVFLVGLSPALAQRTDGPEGSEYDPNEPVLLDSTWQIGVDVGSVFLHADNHNGYKTGIGVGAHAEYYIDDLFALNFSLGYSHHGGPAGVSGMNNLWIDIGPKGRLMWDPIGIFASISPGFVFQQFGNPIDDSAFSFAIDFGTGIDLLVHEHFLMGLTYKYHLVFDQAAGSAGSADFQSLMLKIDFVL